MALYPRPQKIIYDPVKTDTKYSSGTVSKFSQQVRLVNHYADTASTPRQKPDLLISQPTALRRAFAQFYGGSGVFETPLYRPVGQSEWRSVGCASAQLLPKDFQTDPFRLYNGLALLGGTLWVPLSSGESQALCDQDVLSKIKNAQVHLPTVIAEARTTASWLAQRAASVSHAFKAVKKGKWDRLRDLVNGKGEKPPRAVKIAGGRYGYKPDRYRNANRLPYQEPPGWSSRPVAERWLEVSYAVMPAVNDIAGLAILVYQLLEEGKLDFYHATAKQFRFYTKENTLTLSHLYPVISGSVIGSPTRPTFSLTTYTRLCDRVSVWYTLDPSWIAEVVRHGKQIGLTNPVPAAWEVVPWSFVVDHGVTIGNYLELLDATVGCFFLSGTRSCRAQSLPIRGKDGAMDRRAQVTTFRSDPKGARLLDFPIEPSARCDLYQRSVLSGFPKPVVVVKSPISTRNLITYAALFRTNTNYIR